MKDLRTIILAAGKGTRMKSDTPKVLHPVCGKPLIHYTLDIARGVGSLKTFVVLGHQNKQVKEALDKNINIVMQKKLLGTADAVKTCASFFKSYRGDVLILSGDTPLLKKDTILNLVKKHKKSDAACTFLTAVVQNSHGYGRVIRGPDGAAAGIREEGDATEYEKNIVEINAGAYCFKADALFKIVKGVQLNKKKREYYLTDIIEILAEEGRKIETLEAEDASEGLGINDRADLAASERVIRSRVLKNFMLKGVTILDPQNTYIDQDVRIGRDSVIKPFTVIEENVRIGDNCIIGPFAHIRPGTKIGNNVEIGNFAEVSRSHVGDKSLMKHFSFLGDAHIGSHVNIGAGVVTANFDGKDKHPTRIMNGAFIGSDSILVAPVKIGKKAKTGAGSVVVNKRSIPDGCTAVGMPARIVNNKKKTRPR